MSFNILLTSFTKRTNSTALPSSYDLTLSGDLLDDCDITHPSIRIYRGHVSNAHLAYNYCFIQEFNRRYWIDSWEWANPNWVMHCSCDVLGTYKIQIGTSTHYVLRSASSYNTDIPDTLYPATCTKTYAYEEEATPWNPTSGAHETNVRFGTYVVGVACNDAHFGTVEYYAISYDNMPTLIGGLMNAINTTNGFSTNDAQLALQRSLVDPLQFIKSCVFIPIWYNTFIDNEWVTDYESATLTIFDWTISVPNRRLIDFTGNIGVTFTDIPQHPQSNRGSWVNMEPYTEMNVWMPPFGMLPVDTNLVAGASYLRFEMGIDLKSGYGWGRFRTNNTVWDKVKAQIGVPFTLTQITRDYVGGAMSAVGGIASLFTGNWLGAAASVGNAINSAKPRSSTVGSEGSFADLMGVPILYCVFHTLAEENIAEHGRPLCQRVQLNTLSGYILCENAETAIAGSTKEESDEITSYLEGGFFYE